MLIEEGFPEYEVEKIVRHKFNKKGKLQYLIRWKGYDESHDTWEPMENLNNSSDLVRHYNSSAHISVICIDARGGV